MNRMLIVLLALVWGCGFTVNVKGQDEHAGHDHAAHAEDDAHAGHGHGVEEEKKEGEAEEDHAGHDHAAHAEEDPHAGHDHAAHSEGDGLHLAPEQRDRFGIVVQTAGPGSLRSEVTLPGEIVFNEDRVAHLVPRVAGIAQEVRKSMGDEVRAGDVLAVLESRELADAKAEYLAADARASLVEKNFTREDALRTKGVSSEQDYLEAEQSLAEARIVLRSAEQKLHALGFSPSLLEALRREERAAITRYEIRSPIDGVVTEKHISRGESLESTADIFTIVDLSSVWVNLTVYSKHLAAVRPGQEVVLKVDHSGAQVRSTIAMITPFVDAGTRSATARVVLNNRDRRWVPGTFVTGYLRVADENLPVVVPRAAVQNVDGEDVVFVPDGDAFTAQPVAVGRSDRTHVELVAGLEPGTRYVAEGAFELKATMITSNLDSHAGHGH